MKRLWLAFLLWPILALGQSLPNGGVAQGQVWTPAQWNIAWASKADVTTSGNLQKATATNGQTVFNLASPPALFVALDGVLLVPTTDYTVSGNTLTLVNGALTGQTLIVR